MAARAPRILITDERHGRLSNVDVEMYDLATRLVIGRATTGVDGVATFGFVDEDRDVGFRPNLSRNQAGKDRYGHVRLTLLREDRLVIPPVTAEDHGAGGVFIFTSDEIYDIAAASWTEHAGAEGTANLEGAVAGSQDGQCAYLYSDAGTIKLAVSSDSGATWSTATPSPACNIGAQLAFDVGGRLWLDNGIENKLYYSDDLGTSLTEALDYSTDLDGLDDAIICHETDENRLMVLLFDGTDTSLVAQVSTNRGTSWARYNVAAGDVVAAATAIWLASGRIIVAYEKDTDGDIYLYTSTDDGATWTLIDHVTTDLDLSGEPAGGDEFAFFGTRDAAGAAQVLRVNGSALSYTLQSIGVAGNILRGLEYVSGTLYALTDDGDFYSVPSAISAWSPVTRSSSATLASGHGVGVVTS